MVGITLAIISGAGFGQDMILDPENWGQVSEEAPVDAETGRKRKPFMESMHIIAHHFVMKVLTPDFLLDRLPDMGENFRFKHVSNGFKDFRFYLRDFIQARKKQLVEGGAQ